MNTERDTTSRRIPVEATEAPTRSEGTLPSSEELLGEDRSEQARQKASQVKEKTKEKSRQFINTQKVQVADMVVGIADAFRTTARTMEEKNQKTVAGYMDQASRNLMRLSDTLRNRDADDLMQSVKSFAERQRGVILGGAIVAGIALSRFLKSSTERRSSERDEFKRDEVYYGKQVKYGPVHGYYESPADQLIQPQSEQSLSAGKSPDDYAEPGPCCSAEESSEETT